MVNECFYFGNFHASVKICSKGRTRTGDLKDMNLPSYQLLYLAILNKLHLNIPESSLRE